MQEVGQRRRPEAVELAQGIEKVGSSRFASPTGSCSLTGWMGVGWRVSVGSWDWGLGRLGEGRSTETVHGAGRVAKIVVRMK